MLTTMMHAGSREHVLAWCTPLHTSYAVHHGLAAAAMLTTTYYGMLCYAVPTSALHHAGYPLLCITSYAMLLVLCIMY